MAEERFADDDCMTIRGFKSGACSSIILRGANSYLIDEVERCASTSYLPIHKSM